MSSNENSRRSAGGVSLVSAKQTLLVFALSLAGKYQSIVGWLAGGLSAGRLGCFSVALVGAA